VAPVVAVVVLAVIITAIGIVVVRKQQRQIAVAWTAAAQQLGGTFTASPRNLIHAVIDGRPVIACTVQRGSGNSQRTWTEVRGAVRHVDDLAAGTAAPEPRYASWESAYGDADARAGLADHPRPPLPARPRSDLDQLGIVTDPVRLVDLMRAEASACARLELPVAQWVAAAPELGLRTRAAFLLEGEDRGCKVRVVADHVSAQVVVRAFGETRGDDEVLAITTGAPPGGMEDVRRVEAAPAEGYVAFGAPRGEARLSDAVRAALREARPSAVITGTRDVVVIVPGLVPDVPRWQAAIVLAAELAAVPSDGAFR
jgi:hypothetical protein